MRKAHGPQPNNDIRSTTTAVLSRSSDNNQASSNNNQYAAESGVTKNQPRSGDLNANTVNVQSDVNPPNALVCSSPKTDNTLLIAALNQGNWSSRTAANIHDIGAVKRNQSIRFSSSRG